MDLEERRRMMMGSCSKLYLFKEGKGLLGQVVSQTVQTGSVVISADYIKLVSVANSPKVILTSTDGAINFAKYSKLFVECFNTSSKSQTGYKSAACGYTTYSNVSAIRFNNYGEGSFSGFVDYNKVYSNRELFEFDISSITDINYIALAGSTNVHDLYCYNIWLE